MNLDELRRIRETERSTDSLQELRDSFYREVSEYLSDLRVERDTAASAATDPFADPDVRRLSDELDAAERTVEAIYERRVGKIVKLASFAAADMAASREGLTDEERELFDTIVAAIRTNRSAILATLAHEQQDSGSDLPDDAGDVRGVPDPAIESEDDPIDPDRDDETIPASSTGDSAPPDPARTTVRITEDIGTIMGIDDREYLLSADDIVTLPTKNASPLLDRGAAERID